MKRASEKTWELVRSLHSGQSLWDRLLGKMEPPLWAFEEIATLGEPEVIPSLLSFTRSKNRSVQWAAADAISRLFALVQAKDLAEMDELTRDELAYESKANSPWRNLKPNQVDSLADLPGGGLMIGLATFHNNGHVRETAVWLLSRLQDGSEVPFLLLRLNDWVAEVRTAARSALLPKIRADYTGHFFRNLRLVHRLKLCGRDAHAQVIESIESLLVTAEAMPFLREGIASPDRWLRREFFRLAVGSTTTDTSALLRGILTNPDPILRLWATRNLLPRLSQEELRSQLPGLSRDSFMPVRCEALSAMARQLPDIAEGELRQALFDDHASVRALARHYLQQNGIRAFREIYASRLCSKVPKACRGAIAGLGETGQPSDAALLRPFLTVGSVSVRKAALRAAAALDGEHHLDVFLTALKDEHAGVSNAAETALASHRSLLDEDSLWKTFTDEGRFHVRWNTLVLLLRVPTWDRLPFLIRACADRDARIVELARKRLRDWRQRAAALTPTKRDLENMRALLADFESVLDKEFVREMKFWIQQFP